MRTYHPKAPTDPRPEPLLRVLSLGAGVQSTAVALLALEGRIPPFDAAIFADTGWEPGEVYDHLEGNLRPRFDAAGVPLHVVSAGKIREDALDPDHAFASMPLFTSGGPGKAGGMVRRQCTKEYKLVPIRRKILDLVADRLEIDAPTWRSVPRDVYVEQALGISTDESTRARTPRDRWAINYYPLLELRWRRSDCAAYLEREGVPAAKSACIGCPYRDDAGWRRMRDTAPDEFADAVEFDEALRQRLRGTLDRDVFLHSSRLPLADVDLSTAEDGGQLTLDACDSGVCWT